MAETRRAYLILFLMVFILIAAAPLGACPMCTDLVEHGADASKSWRFGRGIGWSILVMLGILFSMIGAFAFAIWKGQKKNLHSSPEECSGGIGH